MARPQYSRKIENAFLTACWVVAFLTFLANVWVSA